MSKSIEQQAADICRGKFSDTEIAAALSRAGLLVSERDVLCRRLAERAKAYRGRWSDAFSSMVAVESNTEWNDFCESFEALAAYDREHAPKPRYRVESLGRAMPTHGVYADGHHTCVFMGTEAECNAVAAALNALPEKEAGR